MFTLKDYLITNNLEEKRICPTVRFSTDTEVLYRLNFFRVKLDQFGCQIFFLKIL